MGKKLGRILALFHFVVTEMRPIWLLWYTIYSTAENATTRSCLTDAYKDFPIRKCLYRHEISVEEIQNCGRTAYQEYLAYGPQSPYQPCTKGCPDSGVYIDAPEPRVLVFCITTWLFGLCHETLAHA